MYVVLTLSKYKTHKVQLKNMPQDKWPVVSVGRISWILRISQ